MTTTTWWRRKYRLVTEGLHLRHLRLVMGYSMGGMQTWLWAEQHPDFAEGFVPMASQPSPMASRNWMMRRLMVETIRDDPTYAGGDYKAAPHSLPYAIASFGVATSGGALGWQAQAPTAAKADAIVARLLASPFRTRMTGCFNGTRRTTTTPRPVCSGSSGRFW